MSKERTPDELYDFIEVHSDITCSKCRTVGWQYGDCNEDYFFDEGWRATENNCYCPKCAAKYLKPQKSKPKTK